MSKYKLPYFDELDLTALEDYYDVHVDFEGRQVKLDLNFNDTSIAKERMALAKPFIEHLDAVNAKALKAIKADYEDEENGDTVREYVDFHLEEIPEQVAELIDEKAKKPAALQLLDKLLLVRAGFYPANEDGFAVLDYTIGREITDNLVVVYFNQDGEVENLSMES